MKRFNSFFVVAMILFLVLPFISCKKDILVDSDGLYIDFEAGRKDAIKKNQNILLFITMDGDDLFSQNFLNNVVRSSEFSEIKDTYTVIHFDFSESSYEKTVYKPEASKADNKLAEKYSDIMLYNAQVASLLDVGYTPALYILTSEGYYIADSLISEQISSVNELSKLVKSFNSKIEYFNRLFAATNEGTSLEKVAAIDAVFEATDMTHRVLLSGLAREVPKLDKVNRTGLVSKYLLAAAESDAINFYRAGQIAEAVNSYNAVTKEKFISPEHKQQAFYMAAYLLISSGTTDFPVILDFLKKSVDSYPNGENVTNIQNIYDYILTVQAEYNAELENQSANQSSDLVLDTSEEQLEQESE